MRIGQNPLKYEALNTTDVYHRIVIPVFIPNEEGYFKNMFEVLQLSMNSLLNTVHTKTAITIINNNSCIKISDYLQALLHERKIDQLISNNENKGKVDPLMAVIKGSLESLITIADCDVLYKANWQQKVEEVFNTYPNVGMVSPLPQPALYNYYSTWSWYFGFTKGGLKKMPNEDVASLEEFKKSIDNKNEFTDIEKKPFTIDYKNIKTIIGAGHFCATYSSLVKNFLPNQSSGINFNGAEELFLDKPVEDAGLLRLATHKGYVYHIGNEVEEWMKNIVFENKLESLIDFKIKNQAYFLHNKFLRKLIIKLFSSVRFKKIKLKLVK